MKKSIKNNKNRKLKYKDKKRKYRNSKKNKQSGGKNNCQSGPWYFPNQSMIKFLSNQTGPSWFYPNFTWPPTGSDSSGSQDINYLNT